MKKLLLLCSLLAYFTGYSQFVFTPFYLDADTNSGYTTANGHTIPYNYAIAGNKMFFTATTAATGREQWITDGSQGGTYMVKDIASGNTSGRFSGHGRVLNGRYFFTAYDAVNGEEMWVSDGTLSGTYMVKDLIVGVNGPTPAGYVPVNNKILINANVWKSGTVCCPELFISDGTQIGTGLVKQIHPTFGESSVYNLSSYNNKVYFTANDSVHGRELWVTDGTAVGTQMVKDIAPGLPSSSLSSFKEALGQMFFFAGNANNGVELWKSDGTANGTQMVKVLKPGPGSSNLTFIEEYKGLLYFKADNDTCAGCLWVTNGTAQGTKIVVDSNNQKIIVTYPGSVFSIYKDKLYIRAGSKYWSNSLYVTDGTLKGTYRAVNMYTKISVNQNIEYLTPYADKLFFKANDTNGNACLWYTEGATKNTYMVRPPNSNKIDPLHDNLGLIVFDSTLYLAAAFDNNGTELWSIKDTSSNTVGVDAIAKDSGYEVFPNPSSGRFTVKTGDNAWPGVQLTVYDVMGRIIGNYTMTTNVLQLDLSGNPTGLYTLHLWSPTDVAILKVIIE